MKGKLEAEEDEAEAKAKKGGPKSEQHQQRKRAIDAVQVLAHSFGGKQKRRRAPGVPCGDEKESCNAEAAHRSAGQDDALEGVEQDNGEGEDAQKQSEKAHDVSIGLAPVWGDVKVL